MLLLHIKEQSGYNSNPLYPLHMVRELLWDLHTINSDEGKALLVMTVG